MLKIWEISVELCFGFFVVFFLESEQITGSVKARGAFNKMCIIKDKNEAAEKKCSITTASSGNHAQACVCKVYLV